MPRGNGKSKFNRQNVMPDHMKQLQGILSEAAYQEEDTGISRDDLAEVIAEQEIPMKGTSIIKIGLGEGCKPLLLKMVQRICTIFRIATPKGFEVTFYAPMEASKIATHVIHPAEMIEERHFLHRIVFVSGSPELFDVSESRMVGMAFGGKKIYVRPGHGIKMNVGSANMMSLKYDDRDTYPRQAADGSMYPGRGVKNPSSRWIVVVDILGESQKEAVEVSLKEAEKYDDVPGVSEMLKTAEADPGAFSSLLSKLTGGYFGN